MFLAAAILTGKVFLGLQHSRIKASIAVPYAMFLINPAFEVHVPPEVPRGLFADMLSPRRASLRTFCGC